MIDQFKADSLGLVELENYYKVWSSSIDGCSCSLCSKLEGTAVTLDEPFKVGSRVIQEPPLHEGCRCAVMFVEKGALEPWLVRVNGAFVGFSNSASKASDFQSFISCFFAAEYFLTQLAAAPEDDLAAAGLLHNDFKSQLQDLQLRRDQIFNIAIKRSFDHEREFCQSLKTERGRRTHMDQWIQIIVASHALAPVNYEYLKELFSQI